MGRSLIACALLTPWPLHLLASSHPGVPVAVLSEHDRRVTYANELAMESGVTPGLRETAALSRCPDLHAEVVSGPTLTARWLSLLELLYSRYSNRVEGREQGVVFLKLTSQAARELAVSLHAPVGLAESLEVAHLAALRVQLGEVREITGSAEQAYLPLSLTGHLHVLGLAPEHVARLHFLGVRGLADLMLWSAAQREAFLGVTVGKKLNRFLRGERTVSVARYVPLRTVEQTFGFDDPLHEPGEVEAALMEVVPPLWAELRGRTASYLLIPG